MKCVCVQRWSYFKAVWVGGGHFYSGGGLFAHCIYMNTGITWTQSVIDFILKMNYIRNISNKISAKKNRQELRIISYKLTLKRTHNPQTQNSISILILHELNLLVASFIGVFSSQPYLFDDQNCNILWCSLIIIAEWIYTIHTFGPMYVYTVGSSSRKQFV